MRGLRLAPLLTGALLLYTCVLTYGFRAQGTAADTLAFLVFGAASCIALASGVYERRRSGPGDAGRENGMRVAIDWDAFDEARAMWHRGGLV